jgi:DNA-binding response OmpR family regulator
MELMTTRTRILIIDTDLDSLSKIYLGLIHRNYKTEASDNTEEIPERVKRLKPAVIIIGKKEYLQQLQKFNIPVILILDKDEETIRSGDEIIILHKPVSIDQLIQAIESVLI